MLLAVILQVHVRTMTAVIRNCESSPQSNTRIIMWRESQQFRWLFSMDVVWGRSLLVVIFMKAKREAQPGQECIVSCPLSHVPLAPHAPISNHSCVNLQLFLQQIYIVPSRRKLSQLLRKYSWSTLMPWVLMMNFGKNSICRSKASCETTQTTQNGSILLFMELTIGMSIWFPLSCYP